MTATSTGWPDGFHHEGCEANRDEGPRDLRSSLCKLSFGCCEFKKVHVPIARQVGCEPAISENL